MWLGTGSFYSRRSVHRWRGRLVFGIRLSLAVPLRKCRRRDGNFRRRRRHIPVRHMPGFCHGIWRWRWRIPVVVLRGFSHGIRRGRWEIPVRVTLGFSHRIGGRLLSRCWRRLPSWFPIAIPLLPVPSTATFTRRTLGLAATRKIPDRGGTPGSSGIPRRFQRIILCGGRRSGNLSIVMFCNSTCDFLLEPGDGNRAREECPRIRLTWTKHK